MLPSVELKNLPMTKILTMENRPKFAVSRTWIIRQAVVALVYSCWSHTYTSNLLPFIGLDILPWTKILTLIIWPKSEVNGPWNIGHEAMALVSSCRLLSSQKPSKFCSIKIQMLLLSDHFHTKLLSSQKPSTFCSIKNSDVITLWPLFHIKLLSNQKPSTFCSINKSVVITLWPLPY